MKMRLIALLLAATVSSAYCGYNWPTVKSLNPIAVAVEMKDAGTLNLITMVSMISERDAGKRSAMSEEYQAMVAELEIDIQGRIVDIVLGKGVIAREDIPNIKKEMDGEIGKLIVAKRKAYFGDKNVNVGCRITSLYFTNLGVQVGAGPSGTRW